MTSVATQQEQSTQVARPLNVLVPLIKQDLQQGADAAKAAGMEYYRAAGEKLLEAKASPQMKHGTFEAWVKRNFSISDTTARTYMGYARATSGMQKGGTPPFPSLNEFHRATGSAAYREVRTKQEWHEPVKASIEEAKRQAARIQEEQLSLKREREELIKLCLHMVDLGYKILSKELHPDKGGSKEAMMRLNKARQYAKAKLL